jgi:hypothetical protein
MLGSVAKVLLVSTAFAPVLLTLAFVRYVQGRTDTRTVVYAALAVALTAACILVLRAAQRALQVIPFTVDSIRTADKEIVAFVVSYLLPLAKLAPTTVDWRVNSFVLGLLVVIVLTTHSYHFNPLLGLLGYHFYEVSTPDKVAFILITKKDMRNKAQISTVVQLTDYIVMEKSP